MQSHRGPTILVLGILGLVLCVPLGLAAWIMGNGDLNKMAAGQMDPEGKGLTSAGKVCGMIATILWAIGLVIYLLLMMLGIAGAAAGAAAGAGAGG